MTTFAYQALDGRGRLVKGRGEASSLVTMRDGLLADALTPISIRAAPGPALRSSRDLSEAAGARFASDLARFVRSGLTLSQALDIIEQTATEPRIAQGAAQVRQGLLSGASLSEALSVFGGQVGRLLQTLARAGEATGRLEDILESGSKSLATSAAFRRRLATMMVYPSFVLAIAVLAVVMFAFVVLPALEPAFSGLGDLPASTEFVLGAGRVLRQFGPHIAIIALGLIGACILLAPLRSRVGAFVQHLGLSPLLGGVGRDMIYSGLAQRLSIALSAGVPLLAAYRISVDSIGVPAVRRVLEEQEPRLRDGCRLSEALEAAPSCPDLLLRLAAVGEGAGELAKVLQEAADALSVRAQERAERLLALFTPMVVLAIGAFVGGLVLIVFQGLMSVTELVDVA